MFSLTLPRLVPLATSVLCVVLVGPAGDPPRYVPQEGTSVRRTLEMHGHRELAGMKLKVGEKEQEIPGATMTQTSSWKHVILDEYRTVTKGDVKKLARKYETMEKTRSETTKNKDGEDQTNETTETCDLDGKTVVFTWNDEKKAYVPAFDGEGDEKLLADLVVPMDYTSLLPEASVAEGETWKGDFDEVRAALLRPGGDVPFHGEKEPLPIDRRMRAALWDSMKGEIELKLGKTVVEDGRSLTPITFQGKFSSDAEVEREGEEKGPDRLHLKDAQTFEGKLTWDLAAGRAATLEWTAKGQLSVATEIPVKTRDGGDATLEQTMTLDEDYEYSVAFETP